MQLPEKKKGRLLIVDDEIEIREILEFNLKPFADHITLAFDGQDAYEKTKQESFDAILSDIKMPRMTGLELLAKIRNEKNFVPFVILTAFGDKAKTVEALKNGAMDFLDKPWDARNLQEVMSNALELGMEMQRWSQEEDAIQGLEELRKGTSNQAIDRLGRAASLMAHEIIELKKKLEKKDHE